MKSFLSGQSLKTVCASGGLGSPGINRWVGNWYTSFPLTLFPFLALTGRTLVKVQLLPRGISVYFWISHVRVWADGKDDTRGI